MFSYSKSVGLPPGTKVVDLFCGIGGFSHGAKLAGHEIVLAVDSNPFLLGAHVRNNPHCRHICCSLPRDDLPLPEEGPWHLHASPPCTKLSIMQPHQYAHERRDAVDLVEWYLELVRQKRPTSWTMEQVNHAAVRDRLDAFKRKNPLLFDWTVANAVDHGVPQQRKRIIAGSPFIIANLRSMPKGKRKRSVRDVIPNPPRPFIRNNLYSRPDEHTQENIPVPVKDQMRSVDEPCYTILAAGHKRWSDENGEVLRHMTAREGSLIQSFPPDYCLPWSSMVSLVGVGNALPPLLAKAFMQPVGAKTK